MTQGIQPFLCTAKSLFLPTCDFLCLFKKDLENKACVFSPQSGGWRVGNCTDRLPFMCQKRGKVQDSEVQTSCRFDEVSIVYISRISKRSLG